MLSRLGRPGTKVTARTANPSMILPSAVGAIRCSSTFTDHWRVPETYTKTRKSIKAGAMSLPPEVYHDESYFKAEQSALWSNQWFAAAHVQDLPQYGDTHVVDIGNQSYILTRDKDMSINAFHNVCRHRGARLCLTNANRRRIACPYHRWSYKLDGTLMSTPMFDEPFFNKAENGLFPIKVETFAGVIWLNVNLDAGPLRNQLGDLPERFKDYPFDEFELQRKKLYNAKCDWKLLCENFMEWYHIPPVHPELAKFSTVAMHQEHQGPGHYCSFVTSPLTDSGGAGDSHNFGISPGHRGDPDTAFFYHVYPNLSITIYPHSIYTLIMHPNQPGQCKENLSLLMHPEVRLPADGDEVFATKVQNLMDFVCNVNDEDVEICEIVGKGVKSQTYRGGIFHGQMELSCYRFQNMIADALTGVENNYPAEMFDYDSTFNAPSDMAILTAGSAEAGQLESPLDLVSEQISSENLLSEPLPDHRRLGR